MREAGGLGGHSGADSSPVPLVWLHMLPCNASLFALNLPFTASVAPDLPSASAFWAHVAAVGRAGNMQGQSQGSTWLLGQPHLHPVQEIQLPLQVHLTGRVVLGKNLNHHNV